MRNNTNKKKIAPVVIAILALLYVGPMVGMVLAAIIGLSETLEWGILPFLLMTGPVYAVIGGAVVAGVLMALAQRLREIDGGEEEDAKKY